jgi:arsenite methyltransferase
MTVAITVTPDELRETVRTKYAEAARRLTSQTGGGCCGPSGSCCSTLGADPITSDLYDAVDAAQVPDTALLASLGCGNPTALAELKPGETVLDLGSGGGIDVLLSARRVGPTGFAYGLDMTDEMLALAEKNRLESGLTNVRFLKGHIEDIPLADNSVDVVISNCVINLSADKPRVLREAYRVLRPGGRFAVSDVVIQGELPADVRQSIEAWVGCVAGALEEGEYRRYLTDAGFADAEVEVTRVYDPAELREIAGEGPAAVRQTAETGRVVSAFIRARK